MISTGLGPGSGTELNQVLLNAGSSKSSLHAYKPKIKACRRKQGRQDEVGMNNLG